MNSVPKNIRIPSVPTLTADVTLMSFSNVGLGFDAKKAESRTFLHGSSSLLRVVKSSEVDLISVCMLPYRTRCFYSKQSENVVTGIVQYHTCCTTYDYRFLVDCQKSFSQHFTFLPIFMVQIDYTQKFFT